MNEKNSFNSTLQARLKKLGLAPVAHAAHVCWVADQASGGRYRAIRFYQDCLTIGARSASAAHELKYQLSAIKESIRDKLDWPKERKLKIRIIIEQPVGE